MAVDPYQESGEFLDLLSGEAWRALRGPVTEALRGAAPKAGPLLDVGAGSGLGTRVMADSFPAAEIFAVEPSPVLRAVLLSRIAAEPALRSRVTVLAAGALDAPLPDRLGAVVAVNMIGHLAPPDRRRFWRRLGDRLAPGAPLVVNLQPPAEPVAVEHTLFATVRVGRHTYEGSGGAEPRGNGSVTWRMRYRVFDEKGSSVHESVIEYDWHVISPAALLRELADAGFAGEIGPFDVIRATLRD
jgi:SAM-dependent methyltransferase